MMRILKSQGREDSRRRFQIRVWMPYFGSCCMMDSWCPSIWYFLTYTGFVCAPDSKFGHSTGTAVFTRRSTMVLLIPSLPLSSNTIKMAIAPVASSPELS